MNVKKINPNKVLEITDTIRHIFLGDCLNKIEFLNDAVDEFKLEFGLYNISGDKIRKVEKMTKYKLYTIQATRYKDRLLTLYFIKRGDDNE